PSRRRQDAGSLARKCCCFPTLLRGWVAGALPAAAPSPLCGWVVGDLPASSLSPLRGWFAGALGTGTDSPSRLTTWLEGD
ncbi:hypothetical protein U9M48_034623, partial [Paspalum notatum var. saurae]